LLCGKGEGETSYASLRPGLRAAAVGDASAAFPVALLASES